MSFPIEQVAQSLREAFAVGTLFGICLGAVGTVLLSEILGAYRQ